MAMVDIQPEILFHFLEKEILITEASRGNNTAASVKRMVRVSMACKKSFNVIVLSWLLKMVFDLLYQLQSC